VSPGEVETWVWPHQHPGFLGPVEDAAFTALYLTPDEWDELDDQAVACGLNRSAFVTSVSRLALGEELAAVVEPLKVAAAGGPEPA
jgi:hypothetical protein